MQLKIDKKERQHHHHQLQQQQHQTHYSPPTTISLPPQQHQQQQKQQEHQNGHQQQRNSNKEVKGEKNLFNLRKFTNIIMSEDVELMFNSGSTVFVETCYDNLIEGEVIAFDYNKKVLLLKCSSSAGNASFNDVHLINLDYVKDIQIKKESKSGENNLTLPVINIQKVEQRAKSATDERRRLTNAFNAGISEDGINVFLNLSKTVGNVTWNSKDIIVLHSVCISPPYKSQNCTSTGNTNDRSKEAVNYIKQLLDQYWSNLAKQAANTVTASTASVSTTQVSATSTTSQQQHANEANKNKINSEIKSRADDKDMPPASSNANSMKSNKINDRNMPITVSSKNKS